MRVRVHRLLRVDGTVATFVGRQTGGKRHTVTFAADRRPAMAIAEALDSGEVVHVDPPAYAMGWR